MTSITILEMRISPPTTYKKILIYSVGDIIQEERPWNIVNVLFNNCSYINNSSRFICTGKEPVTPWLATQAHEMCMLLKTVL